MPRSARLLPAVLLTLAATACSQPGPDEFERASQGLAEKLEIDFAARPSYLDPNVIVLTFDDGPDRTYTPRVLDILRDEGVKASFFINTDNQTMVASDGAAQGLLRRIVAEGHELATHTVHHLDLAVQSAEKIEEEIVGVEATVRAVFGAGAPPLTLLRAPFGRPYQSAAGSAAYQKVAPVVARHAVHIGWAIDSNDWQYQNDPDRVYDHVTGLIKKPGQGAYGIILMHSINPQTVAALPRLIDYMRDSGFVFKQTEDVVRARFGGRSSAELLGAPAGSPDAGGTGGSGGTAVDARPAPAPDAAGASTPPDAAAGGGSSGGVGGSGGVGESGGAGGSGGGSGGSTGGGRAGSSGTTPPPGPPTPSGSSGGCSFAGGQASTPPLALSLAVSALLLGTVRRRVRKRKA
jgi:peptidoglycan/xylan/chitin deacetylase (PgdA/CDA1 family)